MRWLRRQRWGSLWTISRAGGNVEVDSVYVVVLLTSWYGSGFLYLCLTLSSKLYDNHHVGFRMFSICVPVVFQKTAEARRVLRSKGKLYQSHRYGGLQP